ncbi:hypothetical protein ACUIAK_15985 [Bacillus cytotoxicus]
MLSIFQHIKTYQYFPFQPEFEGMADYYTEHREKIYGIKQYYYFINFV